MEWQFFQTNDPGNKSTRLIYGVPETDNVQVSGACVHSSSIGANFSIVTFGADIGDLENGKDTELRVSGGGFDHALKGKIFRATGEEGLNGVEIDIGNDDPLWRAFAEKESLDYLVPGYKAASLDFTRGRDKIQQFVKACETFADATPPAASAAAGGGDDAEKEAFDSAKELGTVEAWEAFIANYPSGFRADLARAYIKKLGSSEPAAAPPASQASTRCLPRPMRPARTGRNFARKIPRRRPSSPSSTGPARCAASYGSISTGSRRITPISNDREQVTLDTFMTHPWMVTDGPGNCLRIVLPQSGGRSSSLAAAASDDRQDGAAKHGAGQEAGGEEGHRLRGRLQAGEGQVQTHHRDREAARLPGRNQASARDRQLRAHHQQQIRLRQGADQGRGQVHGQEPGGRLLRTRLPSPKAANAYRASSCRRGPRPSTHGCPPGQVWNAQEGCHEDD